MYLVQSKGISLYFSKIYLPIAQKEHKPIRHSPHAGVTTDAWCSLTVPTHVSLNHTSYMFLSCLLITFSFMYFSLYLVFIQLFILF